MTSARSFSCSPRRWLWAAPLLFAALGELISERAGVLNINLEAMMLGGAFCGVWAASLTASLLAGFIGAALAGIAIATLHGVLCIALRAEQVVSGVALNILVLGATTYAAGAIFGSDASRSVQTLSVWPVPFLSELPVIGRILFEQTAMTYVAFLLIPLVWWILNRTVAGLALQAVGEQAAGATSMGINVHGVRWMALLACGALAGIGGGQLTSGGSGNVHSERDGRARFRCVGGRRVRAVAAVWHNGPRLFSSPLSNRSRSARKSWAFACRIRYSS